MISDSPTNDGRSKFLGHQLDGDHLLPTNVYGKIVPLDDGNKTSTLRPRAGKEYSKVNRRRSERLESSDGVHSEISSSPVFDFDMADSPSPSRLNTSDGSSQHLSVSPDPVYVNIPSVRPAMSDRSSCYMNVDMTPPGTPPQFSASPQPIELLNPLLNYAEVDMSPSGRSKPRRGSANKLSCSPVNAAPLNYVGIERVESSGDVKKAPRVLAEPSSEYAQIDVNATAAIQKICTDRRSDKGRMSSSPLLSGKLLDRKASFTVRESLILRDRKGSVP